MSKGKGNGRRRGIDQSFVKALAHELRVEILTVLTERIASPNELSNELDEGLSQVSYHVKVLKDYGRIELVNTEPRRGAVEHYYRATSKTLLPAKTWRGVKKGLRAVVGGGLASDLFNDLADALRAKKLTKADSYICRISLVLDVEGWKNVRASAERLTEEVEDEQRAAAKRMTKANGDVGEMKRYTLGLLAFENNQDSSSGKAQRRAVKSTPKKGKTTSNRKSRAGSGAKKAGRKGGTKRRAGTKGR